MLELTRPHPAQPGTQLAPAEASRHRVWGLREHPAGGPWPRCTQYPPVASVAGRNVSRALL